MKCKDKPRKDKLKNNLTQKLKQLKKYREKFEEQKEKQGCRYPYHRGTKKTDKVKADVPVAVPVAVDTAANVANVISSADLTSDSKSASDAAMTAMTVMTDIVRADIGKTNMTVSTASTASTAPTAPTAPTASTASTIPTAPASSPASSRFSKFVDVSKERPDKRFHRMEIWFADLGYHDWRCIEEGWHPVLIISNNANNEFTPIVTVAPITSKTNKLYLPGHVFIDATDVSDAGADIPNFSFRSGSVLLEQITVLDKRQLEKYAGKVISRERIGILNQAIISFLDLFSI